MADRVQGNLLARGIRPGVNHVAAVVQELNFAGVIGVDGAITAGLVAQAASVPLPIRWPIHSNLKSPIRGRSAIGPRYCVYYWLTGWRVSLPAPRPSKNFMESRMTKKPRVSTIGSFFSE